MTLVDTGVDRVVATIPIPGGAPQSMSTAPDGTRLYVGLVDDRGRSTGRIAVVDLRSNTMATPITAAVGASAPAVSRDGSRLYLARRDAGTVAVVDAANGMLLGEVPATPRPGAVALSLDGTRLFAVDAESGGIAAGSIPTGLEPGAGTGTGIAAIAGIRAGKGPHQVAVHPRRPLLAVAADDGTVTAIDTATGRLVASLSLGARLRGIAWAPDGRHLYVTDIDRDALTVIETGGYRVTATVPTGQDPTGVAVLPDGTAAYVSNSGSGTLTVVDLTGQVREPTIRPRAGAPRPAP